MGADDSTTGKRRSEAQETLRRLRRERTLGRLDVLLASARLSAFTVGERRPQPAEVQALQRRVRGVSDRWSPAWTTDAARAAPPSMRTDRDHVVPVIVLVERMLCGDEIEPVLGQSAICRLTHDEHRRTGLEVAFRTKQRDIYEAMLSCRLEDLTDLGWERYRRARIRVFPYTPGGPETLVRAAPGRKHSDGVAEAGTRRR